MRTVDFVFQAYGIEKKIVIEQLEEMRFEWS